MKNLKKVVSSVVALALSASSFAALTASAASVFPDVAEDNTYAAAIGNLYALGIVSGDDTGNFNPDATIKRSEVAKMIVEAFDNIGTPGQQETGFTDVPASHWASGYVAAGVAKNYINGMGDGTFAPDAEITYAQAVKLIVGAMGYTVDAEQNGGWPTGYLSYGKTLKITDGFSLAQDTAVTRAQVAQLIDNALDAPISEYVGTETNILGVPQPKYEAKDGTGQYYVSPLIKYHDAYVIEGRVTGTSADGSVKGDEVQFQVEYSRRWDESGDSTNSYFASGSKYGPYTIKLGSTDADQYPFTYAVAYVYENDDDDWEFLAFNPSGKNVEKIFDASNFDDENKNYSSNVGQSILDTQKIYVSNPKTNYTLASDFQLVVNNVVIEKPTADQLNTYLVDEAVGDITLIDTAATSGSSADGKYDYIKVNFYENAAVSGVQKTSDGYKVLLTDYQAGGKYTIKSSMTLYDDNDDYTYKVRLKEADGTYTEISPADLQEDDIVSVAYNVKDGFSDSSYYDIIACRDTVEGKVSSYSSDDNEYTMNSVAYEVDAYADANYTAGVDIVSGNEYIFTLDAFGRIHSSEETTTSKTYAILDRVYVDTSSDEKKIRVVTEAGGTVTLEAKNTDTWQEAYNLCYNEDGTKKSADQRVITYKSNTSGKLNTIEKASDVKIVTDGEYKASTGKVGSIKIASSAIVVDASDALITKEGAIVDDPDYSTSDYKAASVSTFIDGENYTILAANKSTTDFDYRYVVIVDSDSSFSMENTTLAVVKGTGTGTLAGTDYDTIEVYEGGESTLVYYDGGDVNQFSKGDIIAYSLCSDGYIEDDAHVKILYNNPASKGSEYNLDTLLADAYKKVSGTNALENLGTRVESDEKGFFMQTGINRWDTSESGDSAGYARVALAPIVAKSANSVTLGKLTKDGDNYVTLEDDQLTYGYDSNVRITVINYAETGSNMIYGGQSGDVVATSYKIAQNKETGTINWSNENLKDYTNFAMVKMFDGDITDIVVLVAPEMG